MKIYSFLGTMILCTMSISSTVTETVLRQSYIIIKVEEDYGGKNTNIIN